MVESEETKRKFDSGDSSEEDNDNCSSSSGSGSSGEAKKTCVDCGTSKTPLWRGGPAGPKSLCNACGIKSRKKRQAALGIRSEEKKKKKNRRTNTTTTTTTTNNLNNIHHQEARSNQIDARNCNTKNNNKGVNGNSLLRRSRFSDLGFKVPMMKRSAVERKLWRKLGEEEQAAVLLMALSYGSVYA